MGADRPAASEPAAAEGYEGYGVEQIFRPPLRLRRRAAAGPMNGGDGWSVHAREQGMKGGM